MNDFSSTPNNSTTKNKVFIKKSTIPENIGASLEEFAVDVRAILELVIPVSLHENQGLTLNRGSFSVSA
jgi:hypothetical protein